MNNRELWPFLFVVGTLLFNWPFLDVFAHYLPYYLFGAWGLLIVGLGVFISRASKTDKQNHIV